MTTPHAPIYAYHRADFDFELWPTSILVRSRAAADGPLTVVYPIELITRIFATADGHVVIQLFDGLEMQYMLDRVAAPEACAAFWQLG